MAKRVGYGSPDEASTMSSTAASVLSAGKHEGDMKFFVEEHLLSLLRPTCQHVRDLEDTVNALKQEMRAQNVATDTLSSRVSDHDQQLSNLNAGLSQTDPKMSKMRSEISTEIAEKAQGLRIMMEENWAKTDAQLHEATTSIKTLQTAWKSSDSNIAQLQKGAAETKSCTIRISADLFQLEKSLEGWRHEHLGMSDRLEHTKRQVLDISRHLQKLELTSSAQKAKCDESFRRHSNQLQLFEAKLSKCDFGLEELDQRLGSIHDNYKRLDLSIGQINSELQEEKRTNQEQEATMKKLNVRQAIDVLFQRMEKANEDCAHVLQEIHKLNKEGGKVDHISVKIDKAVDSVAKQAEEILRLDTAQQSLGAQQKRNIDCLRKQEDQHGILKKRADGAEQDIKNLMSFQRDVTAKLGKHADHLEKTDARQDDNESKLEATNEQIRKLTAELLATGEATAKTAISLDLAHEYLSGVSKGLQGAHKQVLHGHEDMLPYKKAPPRTLPSLPGSH